MKHTENFKKNAETPHTYIIHDAVRDYECDVQGIVNNAVYMNYCEHARNKSIAMLGYSLHSLHLKQETAVVAHAELTYKNSLHGGDNYETHTHLTRKGSFKILFQQEIYKILENSEPLLCLEAWFTVVILNAAGKPIAVKDTVFGTYFG